MNKIETKILLSNLIDRIESSTGEELQLGGKLTQKELQALKFALAALEGVEPEPSTTPAPPFTQQATEQYPEQKQSAVEKAETNRKADSEAIALDLSVLKLPEAPQDQRLCLDFGTAMSKVTRVKDSSKTRDETIEVLKLGIPGDQEELSETMLVSSVFIDNDGLLWFGEEAIQQSLLGENDDRERMDNIKRWFSEGSMDSPVAANFNPTQTRLTYGDMVQAYLMYFTWVIDQCLESKGYPRNIHRRFAMPIFDETRRANSEAMLKQMLGNAQILADTFSQSIQGGIHVDQFTEALKHLKKESLSYDFITDAVTEPLGVAGSLISWTTSQHTLAMIVDIGAGTSDFSLFRIKYNANTGKSMSTEVVNSSRGISEAGNHLDKILTSFALKKAGIEPDHELYRNIVGNLNKEIRDAKETLFIEGHVTISLFNNEIVEIDLDEFLALKPVKSFAESLQGCFNQILNDVDESWLRAAPSPSGKPRLAVVLTGGGAELPMAIDLATGTVKAQDVVLELAQSVQFPIWLKQSGLEELEDDYPRIAVSLGGARKAIIPHGKSAALTAGDVKESAVLQGYYQKGS
ncbi:MAG: hypothetical protein RKH07_01960 [Gammaproteobacteria bacterium]